MALLMTTPRVVFMDKHDVESTQVGAASEYLIAAELNIRGLLATIAIRNHRGIDIIVSNSDASISA